MFKLSSGDWPHRLASLVASLWVGGMIAIGYLAVPVLFGALAENRMLAGALAGRMFAVEAYVGMVCAVSLLVCLAWQQRRLHDWSWWLVLAMLALVLLGHFVLQPQMEQLKLQVQPLDVMHSELAGRFVMLHGIASVLYLLQCLLGIGLLLRLRRQPC